MSDVKSIIIYVLVFLVILKILFFLIKKKSFSSVKNKRNIEGKIKKDISLEFINSFHVHDKTYKTFSIPKKNWAIRTIEAPNDELKKIQKDILKELENFFYLPYYITAFRKRYSIKTNAKKHIDRKIVINIDLKDFFHSITSQKIRDRLAYLNIETDIIDKFIDFTTTKNRLPQWAPTSPIIANFVFLPVDKAIINLLKKYDKNVWYTRYADDITFSSDNTKIKDSIRIIIDFLLPNFWYTASIKKTKVYRKHRKQLVTWLVVNERVSYPRWKYMILRSMVYNFLNKWWWEKIKIKWKLSFLRSVDKKKYNKLKFYYRRKFKNTPNYRFLFK